MKKYTLFLLMLCPFLLVERLLAQGAAFSYQGQLQNNGAPASGTYNLTFTLFDTNSGGLSVAGPVTNNGVLVSNGLFTVLVDFGPGALTGGTNWLEIGVETNGANSFATLTPRQQLTPAPYAILAESASNLLGNLPVAQLSGTLLFSQLPGAVLTNNETSATLGNLTLGGDLNLPATAEIFSGGLSLLHADGVTDNFFAGQNAGNLTTRGTWNTGIGDDALNSNTTGSGNTAVGFQALTSNTTGIGNVAEGFQALLNNTNDNGLTAIGFQALQNERAFNTNGLTTGGDGHNTAVGYQALQMDTSGVGNTGVGFIALNQNINGAWNTGIGDFAVQFNTAGSANTGIGANALSWNTTGSNNTATGYDALSLNIVSEDFITGSGNTADGAYAMISETTGSNNVGEGFEALYGNSTGSGNVAVGFQALDNSTNDNNLVAIGYQALMNDNAVNNNGLTSDGNGHNTAIGYQSLKDSTSGVGNTAVGFMTLTLNTNGAFNEAIGDFALFYNTSGSSNTANGADALFFNTTGSNNTADGYDALGSVTTGCYNTATGFEALSVYAAPGVTTGSGNTADGAYAMYSDTTGSNNIALGFGAASNVTAGNYNIEIGNVGAAADNNTILIGTQGVQTNTVIAGIYGSTAASGAPVYVTPAGKLGTLTSSERFKDDIRSMDDASDVLLSLRPVTFRYKAGIDPQATPQFGLVAEEVDQVDPELVLRDDQHQIYTVRYEAVNAMLLNEFLKQHRKVEEQSTEIATLKEKAAKVDSLEQQLNELKQMVRLLAEKK